MNSMPGIETTLVDTLMHLDSETFKHSVRTQRLALTIGEFLRLGEEELEKLALGALTHDIGKLGVPTSILLKKTTLTAKEWSIVQDHVTIGFEIMKQNSASQDIAKIILEHHRWANGKGGYPQHIQDPPTLLTQVVTVADVLDAITSPRSYRPAQSVDAAIDFVYQHSGTRFCADIVNSLSENMQELRKLMHYNEGDELTI